MLYPPLVSGNIGITGGCGGAGACLFVDLWAATSGPVAYGMGAGGIGAGGIAAGAIGGGGAGMLTKETKKFTDKL